MGTGCPDHWTNNELLDYLAGESRPLLQVLLYGRFLRIVFVVTSVAFAATVLAAETKDFKVLDLLRALQTAANTEAIASRQGFGLSGLQTSVAGTKSQAGDQVTALVSLGSFSGKKLPTQWIIRLRLAPASDQAKPATSIRTQYLNTGDSFTFQSEVSTMELETLGPIPRHAKPELALEIKHRQLSVNSGFLGLDLSRAAEVISKVARPPGQVAAGKYHLNTRTHPFSPEETEAGRKNLAALALTPDELRSFAGSVPALYQFLDIVRNTPELQDILLQVLDKPSLIDVFRHGSAEALNLAFLEGGLADGAEIFWPDETKQKFNRLLLNSRSLKSPLLRSLSI